MNNNNMNANVCETKKKIPPKKPPRLFIRSKPGNFPKPEREKRKEGVTGSLFVKNVIENKENRSHLKTINNGGTRTFEEIDQIPICGKKIDELDVAVIEREVVVEKEKDHIYESISDQVALTKNTSSQTEYCRGELQDYLTKAGELIKVFKETSCQTECSTDTNMRRNKKRNSDSQNENTIPLGKTKECRLSSDSSTSTQESHNSADSGHFSVRVNPELSPTEHCQNNDAHYVWEPEGLSQEEVESFMNSLSPDKVPSMLTPEGVAYFNKQLAYQNPKQDTDPTLCTSLTKEQSVALRNLWTNCLETARGTGYIQISENSKNACKSCGKLFRSKEMIVSASDGFRHPSCFSCTVCHNFLTKLIYYADGNSRLFCGRHYAELFKPRCYGCEELIVSGRVVRAMDHSWHPDHFCCAKCGEKITENKYTTEHEKAICLSCHTTHIADKCESCSEKIVIGQKKTSYRDKHWHDECFICEKCEDALVLGSFKIRDEKVVCIECYQQNKSMLCCKCGEEIKPGGQLIDYNNEYYHGHCFSCKSCLQPITSGFVEHQESFYCPGCHQSLFSEKCAQCGLPVAGDGVTYSDQVWHGSCFDCFNCQESISSQKFHLRFGNRYCNGCYEKLFAKQCHSCCKLIKNGAYLTNNDLFWHNECFRCAGCHKNLESIGFHMVEQKTYCPECPDYVY